MRVIDLFSGIGSFSLGLERAGMRTIGFCDNDEFCRLVLAKHWPDVPCHDDVTTMQFTKGQADVICGGFPCQDVSRAGRRAGVSGSRSGLYRELVRAICVVRPKHAIMENVSALLSDGLGAVLGDLAESGVDAEWDCVPAIAIGAPHERDRIWIVTHANEWSGADRRPQPVRRREPGAEEGAGIGPAANADSARELQPQGSFAEFGGRADHRSEEGQPADAADTTRHGCGQGRTRRPPDSFARVRDEARRNAADPYGARLAFREGFIRDAWEKLTAVERGAFGNEHQSVWPSEPALLGMDDGASKGLDGARKRPAKSPLSAQREYRVKALGNSLIPQIPELIGKALMDAAVRRQEALA